MSIPVSCPDCGMRLTAPASAVGKKIKCTRCQAAVPVAGAGFPAPNEARPARSVRKASREDEDDEDDRPRGKSEKGSGVPVLAVVVGCIVLLLVVAVGGVIGFFVLRPAAAITVTTEKVAVPPGGPAVASRKPPAGWTDVRDAEGGYQVFLPGQVAKGQPQLSGPLPAGVHMTLFAGPGDKLTSAARSIQPAGPIPPGTTPDQMFGWLPHWNLGIDPKASEIESKTPITLGGKPGVLIRVKERKKDYSKLMKPGGGKPIEVPNDEFREAFEVLKGLQEATEAAQQEALKKLQDEENSRPGRRELYFITTNGKRVIVVHLKSNGEYADEATMTTIASSFEFL